MESVIIQAARVVLGVVEVQQGDTWLPVPDVDLMASGGVDSTGRIVIGESVAVYLVDTQPDTQLMLDKIIEALDFITTLGNSVATTGSPLDPVTATAAELLSTELAQVKLI